MTPPPNHLPTTSGSRCPNPTATASRLPPPIGGRRRRRCVGSARRDLNFSTVSGRRSSNQGAEREMRSRAPAMRTSEHASDLPRLEHSRDARALRALQVPEIAHTEPTHIERTTP